MVTELSSLPALARISVNSVLAYLSSTESVSAMNIPGKFIFFKGVIVISVSYTQTDNNLHQIRNRNSPADVGGVFAHVVLNLQLPAPFQPFFPSLEYLFIIYSEFTHLCPFHFCFVIFIQ